MTSHSGASPNEAIAGEKPRSQRGASRRFARRFAGTIAILALVVAGLTAVNLAQGPRLSSADINLEGSVASRGARLQLTANQPLAAVAASQVTVQPQADVTASVSGTAITVRFTGMLRYDTDYTVKVDGVAAASHDATSTLHYAFTTPDAHIYALHRNAGHDDVGAKLPDSIRRAALHGRGDGRVVFSAPRIQQYVALDSHLAAVTLDDDDTATLEIASFSRSGSSGGHSSSGQRAQVPLPAAGTVGNLHASPTKNLIGYTFTSAPTAEGRRYENTPFVYDLADPSGIPVELTGLDGLPMNVLDLAFVPGTTSLVAQTDARSLFLVDALGPDALTPLGVHAEMRGFVPGTRTLVVADPTHGSTIDLADGTVTTLDLPTSALSERAYPGKLALLDEHGRYAQLFLRDTAGAERTSAITLTDSTGSDIAFAPAADSSRVRDFCPSPNGQYLAVETISAEGAGDGYPNVPASSAMTTVLVDLATGRSNRSVAGFLPGWCG